MTESPLVSRLRDLVKEYDHPVYRGNGYAKGIAATAKHVLELASPAEAVVTGDSPVWVVQGRPKPPHGFLERLSYAHQYGRPRVYKTAGDEWYVAGPVSEDAKRYYRTWEEAIEVALNSVAGS